MSLYKMFLPNAVFVLLFLFILRGDLWALEPAPLPSFEVTTMGGDTVLSDQISLQGKWLFIYIKPRCGPCDSLLNLLRAETMSSAPQKIVIVVEGDVENAKEMTRKYPDLIQAAWYADPAKSAFSQLRLQGAPVILGINEETIEWSVKGVFSNADNFKSILKTWIEN